MGNGHMPPPPLADPRECQGHVPSLGSKFFHFHAVWAKKLQNNRLAHPLWKILGLQPSAHPLWTEECDRND